MGLTAGLTFDGTSGVTQAQFETMLKNGSALIGKPLYRHQLEEQHAKL